MAATALMVLVGVLAAILGAGAVARSDADKAKLSFHLTTAEIASTLKLAIQHEEDLVISASAYVTANANSSAADFDRWASSVHAMQRYPELQDIGFLRLVPASKLAAFQARMAANPIRPLGPNSLGPVEGNQILPPGSRSFYCLAVAGLARNISTFLPTGLDYCALAPTLMVARNSGVPDYAPFVAGGNTTLGVETPVYAGGVNPRTLAGRKRAFLGWLAERVEPEVVLERALEGHPNFAVKFSYDSLNSHVVFDSGHAPAGAQSSTINLHNGWTVQSYGATAVGGTLGDANALTMLVGGMLLSVVFGLLLLVLVTGRTRALALVNEKTRELSHQALHDALTGLPNRALVLDRADQLLSRAARNPGTVAGALYIDIDGFKHVNDSLGHAAGDQLLKTVGERLQGAVRDEDTVGRLGGDEFVVLVASTSSETASDVLADRLTEVLREPIELDDGRKIFSVTASIGVAVGHYSTPDALLRDADLALYAAKAAGKDRYALFDASMHEGNEGREELEADMSEAVRGDQLSLLYQPIFDLRSHEIVAAEALVRWQHPTRGVIGPDGFIPLAEDSGMIVPIGGWVLSEACRQAAAWSARGLDIGMSVNVSAHQLARDGFAGEVRQALVESGLDPALLTLEVTETTLMSDVAAACDHLTEVKELGVRVAIDDFGTGYASLSQLQRLPVDILKIDQSFIAALADGGKSRELLEAILGVARALSLAVIAEGVEFEGQMTTLEEMGCGMAQGFLLGRPGDATDIEARVSSPPSGRPRTASPAT